MRNQTYGPRVARLLARCQADAEFASTCLARLPEPARDQIRRGPERQVPDAE